jgi:hypothetical protein
MEELTKARVKAAEQEVNKYGYKVRCLALAIHLRVF